MASKVRAPETGTRGAHHEFASLAEAFQNVSAYETLQDFVSAEDDDSPKKTKAAIAKKWKVCGALWVSQASMISVSATADYDAISHRAYRVA